MRRLQYLIKWKGYPHSDNTWEPVQNLHADVLVKAYHRKHPLEDKSPRKVRARTLSNWILQSTPSSSLHTLSSHLLVSTTPPTGKKPPSALPCRLTPSICPTSRPEALRRPCSPLRQAGPPSLTPHLCRPEQSWQPSTATLTSPLRNSANSSTASPSLFRPEPHSTPLRW